MCETTKLVNSNSSNTIDASVDYTYVEYPEIVKNVYVINVIKTIICIEIYFKIIIVNFASFVHISTRKF